MTTTRYPRCGLADDDDDGAERLLCLSFLKFYLITNRKRLNYYVLLRRLGRYLWPYPKRMGTFSEYLLTLRLTDRELQLRLSGGKNWEEKGKNVFSLWCRRRFWNRDASYPYASILHAVHKSCHQFSFFRNQESKPKTYAHQLTIWSNALAYPFM